MHDKSLLICKTQTYDAASKQNINITHAHKLQTNTKPFKSTGHPRKQKRKGKIAAIVQVFGAAAGPCRSEDANPS